MDACICNNFVFIFFILVKNYCKVKKPETGCREHQKVYLKYVLESCVNICVEKIYINEYIIFCKNHNFKGQNNKITIMNSATRSQSKKGYNFCMKETHKLYKVYKFILILKEFIQK